MTASLFTMICMMCVLVVGSIFPHRALLADMISPELAVPIYPNMPTSPLRGTPNPVVSIANSPMSLSTYLQSKLIGMTHPIQLNGDWAPCLGLNLTREPQGYALSCRIPNNGVVTAKLVLSGRLGDAPTAARLGMLNRDVKAKKAMATYEARESIAIQGLFGDALTSESNLQTNINNVPDSTLPTASHADMLRVWDIGTQQFKLQTVVVVQNQLLTDTLVPLTLTLELSE